MGCGPGSCAVGFSIHLGSLGPALGRPDCVTHKGCASGLAAPLRAPSRLVPRSPRWMPRKPVLYAMLPGPTTQHDLRHRLLEELE